MKKMMTTRRTGENYTFVAQTPPPRIASDLPGRIWGGPQMRHEQVRSIDLLLCRNSAGHPVLDALHAPWFVESKDFGNLRRTTKVKNESLIVFIGHADIKHYV
ncbi:hypothetical protein V8G57_15580 [Collimonas sp. H4R21]|uniref:Uncharacterized protein n=1 Tax=Collimonas rhizosphaerae TaxID=3126357 RepID=A0ABU9PXS8_9BURK